MIKAWNRSIDSHFRSFHLEVLVLHVFNNVTISDFPSGLRFFFDKCRALISKQNADPADYGGDVGSYVHTQAQIQEAEQKFNLAYERALKAEQYAAQGRTSDAWDMWGKILGDYFPAYG